MKNVVFAILLTITSSASVAQVGDLMIKNSGKGLYVDHKVTAKENFYSIGRLYNAPPKEIAAFNSLDMDKGLNLGQTIHIPLLETNFSQSVNEGTPVYYKVGEKEGLMKVSNSNNKVLLESLRRWNNLSSDKLNAGDKLIVGFIVSGQLPEITISGAEKEKEVKKEIVVDKKQDRQTENKVASPKANLNTVVIDESNPEAVGGYFKSFFEQQVKTLPVSKNETVTSGIFKTTSGWKDHKYYLLMDSVQPGTIIKIVNPNNNRTVYAKVLGEMSGIRQNAGCQARISNAAASALEINETDKFIVNLNY